MALQRDQNYTACPALFVTANYHTAITMSTLSRAMTHETGFSSYRMWNQSVMSETAPDNLCDWHLVLCCKRSVHFLVLPHNCYIRYYKYYTTCICIVIIWFSHTYTYTYI